MAVMVLNFIAQLKKNIETINQFKERDIYTPAVFLAKDVLDSLCQSECLACAIRPNDQDWG